MSDAPNSTPADDENLADDETTAPSQAKDPDEQFQAPSTDDPSVDHEATGIGVIGDE